MSGIVPVTVIYLTVYRLLIRELSTIMVGRGGGLKYSMMVTIFTSPPTCRQFLLLPLMCENFSGLPIALSCPNIDMHFLARISQKRFVNLQKFCAPSFHKYFVPPLFQLPLSIIDDNSLRFQNKNYPYTIFGMPTHCGVAYECVRLLEVT